jgi:type II secretory pathway component PulK
MPRTVAGREGYALLAVLWVLIVAAAIAAELHATVRADQRVAANSRAAARARWAARGGMARAVEALRSRLAVAAATGAALASADTLLVPVDTLDLDGVVSVATVTDARARLQLNLATPDELRSLFVALGWDPERAAARALAVARWRAARSPAVEIAAVDTLRPTLRPRPGGFASVDELRAVPEITPVEYAAAEPYLTVVSDGRINVNAAAVPVLRTLPTMTPERAAALVERRKRAPLTTVYDALGEIPGASRGTALEVAARWMARAAFAPREAEIRVTAAAPGTPVRATIRGVAVMTGGTRLPVVEVVER